MFRLTTKLACSNLIKNRKLYYPFAIAVILAVTIAYLFDSLTFNPHIHELRGGDPMIFTLVLGLFVVNAAGAIIVLYANSFVMKNRSKELGIYSMLGLEKRHLISMIFKAHSPLIIPLPTAKTLKPFSACSSSESPFTFP